MTHAAHRLKSPRKTIAAALLFAAMAWAPAAHANAVVMDMGACADLMVMAAPSGYAVVQWNAGQALSKADTITGDITGTGFLNATVLHGGAVRLMVENFGMNYAAATQLLRMRCGVVNRPLAIP